MAGRSILPVKLISPATSKLPPTPRLLVTVDVPTTSNSKSGFVLPTPSLPWCVNDSSSSFVWPYNHAKRPVWIPVPLPAWMKELIWTCVVINNI